jgi:hypothetical protein
VVGYRAFLKPHLSFSKYAAAPAFFCVAFGGGYRHYCGVDQSKKAIESARVDQNDTTRFEVGAAEVFGTIQELRCDQQFFVTGSLRHLWWRRHDLLFCAEKTF